MPAERHSRGIAKLALEVHRATREARLPPGTDFGRWVQAALRAADAQRAGTLGIRLVGLTEGQSLNETWRRKQGATNVLAFPGPGVGRRAPDLPADVPPELGDLVICLPVVQKEAREQHKTQKAHLAHLVVHGTLHLLGHTHERPADAACMEAVEISALAALGFANPYAQSHNVPRVRARRRPGSK
jgi:probable rRNA maturation factor